MAERAQMMYVAQEKKGYPLFSPVRNSSSFTRFMVGKRRIEGKQSWISEVISQPRPTHNDFELLN